ncbi:MAG TPA: hypothetical protein PLQ35_10745 [bacterium]|nr:hypothetical protein [bacterium]HQL62760.1 hypothetical protein [bacterium]
MPILPAEEKPFTLIPVNDRISTVIPANNRICTVIPAEAGIQANSPLPRPQGRSGGWGFFLPGC